MWTTAALCVAVLGAVALYKTIATPATAPGPPTAPGSATAPASRSASTTARIANTATACEPSELSLQGGLAVAADLKPGDYQITCGLLSNARGRLHVGADEVAAPSKPPLIELIGPIAEYKVYLVG